MLNDTKKTNKRAFRLDLSEEELEKNSTIYNDYFDKDYTFELISKIVQPIAKIWFRSEFIGFDKRYPERNEPNTPLIFSSNHSGMAFPWDGMIFAQGIIEKFGFSEKFLRPLVSPMLTDILYMSPYLIKDVWNKVGGVDATYKNFDTMMHNPKENVLIYPEGVNGIAKGFNKRYQFQKFSPSFIRMSIKYKTDIVTFSTINAEYNNPFAYKSNFFNKLANKIGIPFLPVGLTTLIVILQPWFFYFAFPAKLTFVMGKTIKPYQMIDKPYEEITNKEFRKINDDIKQIMQEQLQKDREKYGKKPYKIGELIKSIVKNIKYFPKFFFPLWALSMNDFDYQYKRAKKKKIPFKYKKGFFRNFTIFFKRPITIAFYIPLFGWLPIFWKSYMDKKEKF